ncbi:MAG: ATP-binding protein [Gemmataceae bacterium]
MIDSDSFGPRAYQDANATVLTRFDRCPPGLKATMDGNYEIPETAPAEIDEALAQLQKLATLGQLTSEVAHDFGNLLTVMLGYCELVLADLPPDGPACRSLEEVFRAAERASALTAQILGYCRTATPMTGPIDLAAVVRGLGTMLGRLFGNKVDLRVTAGAECRTYVDLKQAEQLVVNLILNARDALRAYDRRIDAIVESVALTSSIPVRLGTIGSGDYVRLRVRDTGCGMSDDTVARLFAPFFTTKATGTGLGLTIVARVVKQAAAAVAVQSQLGCGTTFDVYFPRAD